MRLSKFLAAAQGLSRRSADQLIENSRVTINGKQAKLGEKILGDEEIKVNGQIVKNILPNKVYVLLNKPIGYICSRRKQGNAPTIFSLLPQKFHNLHPVGRLDKDSSGVLLLTNDGDFTLKMTHPSYKKLKQYQITLDKPLELSHQQMINDSGVTLTDGKSKFLLDKLNENRLEWRITMHEGRNRQIRRTFAALGYEVKKLNRTKFGDFTIKNLEPGEFKEVKV